MPQATQEIKVTLSDMDGTLLETEEIYESIRDSLMQKYNVTLSEEDLIDFRGAGTQVLYKLMSDASDEFVKDHPDLKGFAKGRIKEYYNVLAARPDLATEITPVLDTFKELVENNEPALIVTNSSFKTVKKTMKSVGVKEEFWRNAIAADYVVSKGYSIKPSGDPYFVGLQRINKQFNENYHPNECIVFEDSKVGVRSGLDFGGHVLHVITDPSQMLSETEVDEMRKASSYYKTHKDSLKSAFAMTYTACKPEDFEKTYKKIIEDSRQAKPFKLYNDLT